MSEKITKEISRIMTEYITVCKNFELLRAELEHLAIIANREGYIECMETTQKAIK